LPHRFRQHTNGLWQNPLPEDVCLLILFCLEVAMNTDLSRRNFLRTASVALALIPVVVARSAQARSNPTLRAQLQYQNSPKNEMSCVSCLEFIPGKSEQDLGGCKVIPDDNEIAANGYCTSWNTM
jgi:hypothetical protein